MNKLSSYLVIFLVLIIAGYFFVVKIINKKTESGQPEVNRSMVDFTINGKLSIEKQKTELAPKAPEKKIADVFFEVPYVSEAPDGVFTGPWKNACEEASISMVEGYYSGKKIIEVKEAKEFMSMLFAKQDALYGTNHNSDATRTAEMINKYSSYSALIKENPTLIEIKNEIDQGRPVITPNYGFGLKNPNIPFASTGSSYHMVVVIGYNDETREFITNDSGDAKTGAGYRYGYDLFMATIRDYDYSINKVSGPPRAIFTFRKPAS